MIHRGHRAAQLEPVLLWHLPRGDGDEAGQPRLGRQRVVTARVEAPFCDVVADGKQMALMVEQKIEIRFADELLEQAHQVCSAFAQRLDFGARGVKLALPIVHEPCSRVEPSPRGAIAHVPRSPAERLYFLRDAVQPLPHCRRCFGRLFQIDPQLPDAGADRARGVAALSGGNRHHVAFEQVERIEEASRDRGRRSLGTLHNLRQRNFQGQQIAQQISAVHR